MLLFLLGIVERIVAISTAGTGAAASLFLSLTPTSHTTFSLHANVLSPKSTCYVLMHQMYHSWFVLECQAVLVTSLTFVYLAVIYQSFLVLPFAMIPADPNTLSYGGFFNVLEFGWWLQLLLAGQRLISLALIPSSCAHCKDYDYVKKCQHMVSWVRSETTQLTTLSMGHENILNTLSHSSITTCQHWVDDVNNHRHDPVGVEEVWATKWRKIRQFALIFSVA